MRQNHKKSIKDKKIFLDARNFWTYFRDRFWGVILQGYP